MPKGNYSKDYIDAKFGEDERRIDDNEKDIGSIRRNFVQKIEFKPYKDLIRGLVGTILLIVLTAIVGLVIKNALQ